MSSGNCFDIGILQLRDELIRIAEEVAAKYACDRGAKMRAINLLLEHLCERYIVEKLRLGYIEDEIDRIWRNLHDYSVALLVDRLKEELVTEGFPVSIVNEAENPVGRYDVLLIVNRGKVQILNCGGNICMEVKSGLNVALNQAEKYMWNGTLVVLVRLLTGDVITLRADEWTGFLKFALAQRIKKAERILEGKVILIPGRDCYECPLKTCRFNKNGGERCLEGKVQDLNRLFKDFGQKAHITIEKAVNVVAEELRKMLSGESNPPKMEVRP
ncbi:MAG: hypothetical protein QW702_09110 [Candidatus Bathyarchaeia archaeon]